MATNPTLITTPFAQSGDKTTPPNTNTPSDGRFSQTLGFPPVTAIPLGSGGKAPKREDFNGAFNMLSNIAFYAQKGWQFKFDAGQAYFAGCIVRDTTDGGLYECINDVAAGGLVPSADSTNWKKATATGFPVGIILPYASSGTPSGFLYCDGSAVSRTTYSALYAKIGTTYGSGDGSTTFNIPNLSDSRFLEGYSSVGTQHSAGIPKITGTFAIKRGSSTHSDAYESTDSPTGAFTVDVNKTVAFTYTAYTGTQTSQLSKASVFSFDSSASSSVYNSSTTVQPKSLTVRYVIKYE